MVIVTGTAGYLGNALVRQFLSRDKTARAVVSPFEDTAFLAGLNVEIDEGNACHIQSPSRFANSGIWTCVKSVVMTTILQ